MVRFSRSKEGDQIAYDYSESQELNVLPGTATPVAAEPWAVASTMSKTMARVETDDPDP